MSNLPPAEVLAARLEHELTSMALYAKADKDLTMLSHIAKAKGVLAQLREAMK